MLLYDNKYIYIKQNANNIIKELDCRYIIKVIRVKVLVCVYKVGKRKEFISDEDVSLSRSLR